MFVHVYLCVHACMDVGVVESFFLREWIKHEREISNNECFSHYCIDIFVFFLLQLGKCMHSALFSYFMGAKNVLLMRITYERGSPVLCSSPIQNLLEEIFLIDFSSV